MGVVLDPQIIMSVNGGGNRKVCVERLLSL